MTRRLPGWKSDIEAIRQILLSDWNPIGFDVPDDEYDEYIPQLYQMIRNQASVDQLSHHLSQVESDRIGLTAIQERNHRVAELLLKLALSDVDNE